MHQLRQQAACLGTGIDHPPAGIDDRPLRGRKQIDGLGNGRRVGLRLRAVAAVDHLVLFEIAALGLQHVLRQVHHHRPRSSVNGDVEGLVQSARQIADRTDEIVVFCAGPRDAGGIRLLKGVVADQVGRHLPRPPDERDGIHQGIGQAGHCVGRPRSGGDQHHARFAGRAGIALRRMHRGLLVPDQDVAQAVLLKQGVIDRQHRAARISENDLYALVDQRLDDHLRAAIRICLAVDRRLGGSRGSGLRTGSLGGGLGGGGGHRVKSSRAR